MSTASATVLRIALHVDTSGTAPRAAQVRRRAGTGLCGGCVGRVARSVGLGASGVGLGGCSVDQRLATGRSRVVAGRRWHGSIVRRAARQNHDEDRTKDGRQRTEIRVHDELCAHQPARRVNNRGIPTRIQLVLRNAANRTRRLASTRRLTSARACRGSVSRGWRRSLGRQSRAGSRRTAVQRRAPRSLPSR